MKLDPAIRDQVLATVPSLRAFAISLCGNVDRADDLVQETLLRALAHIDSSSPAPTCRRGCSPSSATCSAPNIASGAARWRMPTAAMPKRSNRIPSRPAGWNSKNSAPLGQTAVRSARGTDPGGASGFSYDDAAAICGCAVGTIKSRVNRARTRLADLLAIDSVDDFGPDRATRAVLAGGGRG